MKNKTNKQTIKKALGAASCTVALRLPRLMRKVKAEGGADAFFYLNFPLKSF